MCIDMIREVTQADLKQLQQISYRTFDETFRAQNKKENIDNYLATAFTEEKLLKELDCPHSYFYFIEHEGQLAGYLKLNTLDAQTEDVASNSLEIERIYILKDFQKAGLGKALFNLALQVAQDKQCDNIWLGVWEKNDNAIQFYKKLGFQTVDAHAFMMGDERQIDHIMIKRLKGE